MTTRDALVRSFLAAWEHRDTDFILGLLAEDAVYHAIPMTPIVGKPAIAEFIERRAESPPPRIVIHNQVTAGDVVMNERTDHIVLNEHAVTLEICAVFEITDGKISAWREYFDVAPAKAAYEHR